MKILKLKETFTDKEEMLSECQIRRQNVDPYNELRMRKANFKLREAEAKHGRRLAKNELEKEKYALDKDIQLKNIATEKQIITAKQGKIVRKTSKKQETRAAHKEKLNDLSNTNIASPQT